MKLGRILEGVHVSKMLHAKFGQMIQTHEIEIRAIQYDSRRVERSDLFVAIRGAAFDGHKFINEAVGRGAVAVVLEDDSMMPDALFIHAGVAKIVVGESRKALAIMAGNFYDHPSRKLRLIGVTGTNGKTTTTHLIRSILEAAGEKVGLIGTIGYHTGLDAVTAVHTTPESPELNRLLSTVVGNGCSCAVMEVSSHSLVMRRVDGLQFVAATFTNLTQDHLDFHGSMEEYYRAKKILFDGLSSDAWAVSNADDTQGRDIVSSTAGQCLFYGVHEGADVLGREISVGIEGTRMTVHYNNEDHAVSSPLIGRFNVENILAAYATCAGLGVQALDIRRGISSLEAVRGRFERIRLSDGSTAVIDYAHTPDALENCLSAISDLLAKGSGRVITIFGCGGNRDRGKRMKMGAIATEFSDITIVTSDNPRDEDPLMIIQNILSGVIPGKTVHVEMDRRKAIAYGLGLARRGDVVLIAGKGHETYQVIGQTKEHFDDREEVEKFMAGK